MNITKKFFKVLMGMVMLSFLATASAVFAQAATVFELTGTATAAIITPGTTPPVGRMLRKGDTVNQGETVKTEASSFMVLRFQDGQVVAMSANASMAINNYVYNAAEPAKSNVLLSLLNGGMRALTGLIGKARPEAVAYRAGNATIGIRGTDVVMSFAGGPFVVSVVAGQISFTANGSTVTIDAGRGTYIDLSDPKKPPVVVISQADLAKAIANSGNQQLSDSLRILTFPGNTENMTRASNSGTSVAITQTSAALTGALGQGNAGGQSAGGAGGGGSTLPNCSLVSPVSSQKPGVNCIAGK